MALGGALAECETAERVEVLTLAIVVVKTSLRAISRCPLTQKEFLSYRLRLPLVLSADRRAQRDSDYQ